MTETVAPERSTDGVVDALSQDPSKNPLPENSPSGKLNLMRFGAMAAMLLGSVGCDQATKAVARQQLGDGKSHEYFSGALRLVHAENPGAFLGLGKNLPESWRLAILIGGVSLILVVVASMLFRRVAEENGRFPSLASLGMGLLLAGGVGNLIDRMIGNSTVTDFVQLRLGPLSTGVFNAADVFIIIGAGAVLIAALFPDQTLGDTSEVPADAPARE